MPHISCFIYTDQHKLVHNNVKNKKKIILKIAKKCRVNDKNSEYKVLHKIKHIGEKYIKRNCYICANKFICMCVIVFFSI